jgi:septin family protein
MDQMSEFFEVVKSWLPLILSGGALGFVGYFRWKPKHPVDVKAAEVKINTDKINNDNLIIAQLIEDYKRIALHLKTLEEKLSEERRQRSEQEAHCDEKIGELNRKLESRQNQLDKVMSEIVQAKNRCPEGCFYSHAQD